LSSPVFLPQRVGLRHITLAQIQRILTSTNLDAFDPAMMPGCFSHNGHANPLRQTVAMAR
jgi:hypothetical protein